MKRRICFLLCCFLFLTACAAPARSGTDAGGNAGKDAGDARDAGDAPVTRGLSMDAAPVPDTVENNGGYYVRVNDGVYFRKYGPDALSRTGYFGNFVEDWNATGMESEIVRYDLSTGAVETRFIDTGFGGLWYGDGGFYLNERRNGTEYVDWYSPDGAERREVEPGRIVGVTDAGTLAVSGYGNGENRFTLYPPEGEPVRFETENEYAALGVTDDGLFLLEYGGGEEEAPSCLWQVLADGSGLTRLGELPPIDTEELYSYPEPGQFLEGTGKIAVSLGYYAGTGHFLSHAVYVEAVPGQADSLTVLDPGPLPDGVEYLDTPLRFYLDDGGEFAFADDLPDDMRTNYDTGNLERFDGENWKIMAVGLCPGRDWADGSGYGAFLQNAAYIDGAAYVTVGCGESSPAEDIGWRDAYTLLAVKYVRISGGGLDTLEDPEEAARITALDWLPEDSFLEPLAVVDHGAVFTGNVWFLQDRYAMLWQEGADEYHDAASRACLLPLAGGPQWEGGEDAIRDGYVLPSIDDLTGFDGYYGYDVPETPGNWIAFRLNADGEVYFLTTTAPDALLSIQMEETDAPPSGAVEALDIQPRPSDEDTPWYWSTLTALQDGVTVRVERTPDEQDDMTRTALEETFIPVELLTRTLNRGEFIALRASLPWHSELRVSVWKDGNWGAYVFGEDNYFHMETEDGGIPERTLSGYPPAEGENLWEAVAGVWLYLDPSTGTPSATLSLGAGYCRLAVESGGGSASLTPSWERMYSGPYDRPDLLCLTVEDTDREAVDAVGWSGPAGDYLVSLYRTDGEELLCLTQMNNGDGALSALLPGGETRRQFTFRRYLGAAQPGAPLRNTTVKAVAVKYDGTGNILWLQEAEQIDEYEDGTPFYRAIPNAPCLAYPVTSQTAARPVLDCENPSAPMTVFTVTVNRDGQVVSVT